MWNQNPSASLIASQKKARKAIREANQILAILQRNRRETAKKENR